MNSLRVIASCACQMIPRYALCAHLSKHEPYSCSIAPRLHSTVSSVSLREAQTKDGGPLVRLDDIELNPLAFHAVKFARGINWLRLAYCMCKGRRAVSSLLHNRSSEWFDLCRMEGKKKVYTISAGLHGSLAQECRGCMLRLRV